MLCSVHEANLCIANVHVLRALRTLLPGICIVCDIYTHYTSLLCKDVMFESHLDHWEPLHVGGSLIDCYLSIIGVRG